MTGSVSYQAIRDGRTEKVPVTALVSVEVSSKHSVPQSRVR